MINADATTEKHATAKCNIGFYFRGLETGETISTCTASVSPSGLTLTGSVQIQSPKVTQFVEGGTAGTDYTVRFHIKTSTNYEDDFDYIVKVIT